MAFIYLTMIDIGKRLDGEIEKSLFNSNHFLSINKTEKGSRIIFSIMGYPRVDVKESTQEIANKIIERNEK